MIETGAGAQAFSLDLTVVVTISAAKAAACSFTASYYPLSPARATGGARARI